MPRAGTALGFYVLLWAVLVIASGVTLPLKRFIPDAQLFIATAGLIQAALIVLALGAFLRSRGFAPQTTLGLTPTRFGLVLWGAVGIVPLGMITGLILTPIIQMMPWLLSKELEALVRLSRFSALQNYLFYALALSVGPALSEELAFRGLILQGLRSRLGAVSAVVVTALFFGVIHLDIVQGVLAFVIGLYLGYLTVRSGSIYPALVAHAWNNLWATFEAGLWQAANPQMSPKDILLSAGYPWWAYVLAGLVLIGAVYAFHRASVRDWS